MVRVFKTTLARRAPVLFTLFFLAGGLVGVALPAAAQTLPGNQSGNQSVNQEATNQQTGTSAFKSPFGIVRNDDKEEEVRAVPVPVVTAEELPRFLITRTEATDWAGTLIPEAVARGQMVGVSIAVLTADGPLLTKGYGLSSLESKEDMQPDVTFLPVGRFGNRFVVERLLDLEAEGLVSLDQRAEIFLTRLSLPQAYQDLTVASLFGTSSGISPSPRGSQVRRGSDTHSTARALSRRLNRDALSPPPPPGRSPTAEALGGMVLEDVGGKPLSETLKLILETRHKAHPWINDTKQEVPAYTARAHTLSRDGKPRMVPFLASAPGYVGTNGIHLTMADLGDILSRDLASLTRDDLATLRITALLYDEDRLMINQSEAPVFHFVSTAPGQSLDIRLLPKFGIGLVVVVNSSSPQTDLGSNARTGTLPPLTAMDIGNNFLAFLQARPSSDLPPLQPVDDLETALTEDEAVLASTASQIIGTYKKQRLATHGPDRILEALSPGLRVRQTSDGLTIDGEGGFEEKSAEPLKTHPDLSFASALTGQSARFGATDGAKTLVFEGDHFTRQTSRAMLTPALLWTALILQLALFAAIRWPALTRGETLLKGLGAAGAAVMMLAFLMPVALAVFGHPRTLADLPYQTSLAAFPVAIILAALVVLGTAQAWRSSYWGSDGHGIPRRIIFSLGALGLSVLAVLTVQWHLVTLP